MHRIDATFGSLVADTLVVAAIKFDRFAEESDASVAKGELGATGMLVTNGVQRRAGIGTIGGEGEPLCQAARTGLFLLRLVIPFIHIGLFGIFLLDQISCRVLALLSRAADQDRGNEE